MTMKNGVMDTTKQTSDIERPLGRSSAESMKHYTVPEGFFEELNVRIMDSLPEREDVPQQVSPNWWAKVKPSLYLAASFVSIFLAIKGLMYVQGRSQGVDHPVESDYISYYEDYASRLEGSEELLELSEAQYYETSYFSEDEL